MRLLLGFLFVAMPIFAATPPKKANPPKKKDNHVTPAVDVSVNRDQEIKVRDYMIEISRQLGVTCNYCHDVKNFRTNEMKTWKTGKDHIRIVELLNSKGFVNGPKADCYLCHRGKVVPDYKEPTILKPDADH